MADIALDRTYGQRLAAALAEGMPDCGRLDRIACRGPGTVHFEEGQIVGGDTRPGMDRADQTGLRRLARHRQADRATVGTDPGTGDNRADRIAVSDCLSQRLQDNRGAALAPDIAVGAFVESKAPATL
jgi:hypothetical protein